MKAGRCPDARLRHRVQAGLCLVLCACVAASAQPAAPAIEAHLHGWGHSCAGELVLTRRTLSWVTPWSPCRAAPFQIVEQHDRNGDIDRLYHFTRTTKACSYPYVKITYGHDAPGLAWYAQGFTNLQSAQHRDAVNSLGCQLEEVSFRRPQP